MRSRCFRLAPIALLLLTACATAPVPLTSQAPSFGSEEDEKTLLQRAASLDAELLRKGLVLNDAGAERYVQQVGERLVPGESAKVVQFRFRVLRDPLVNAFALPNGSVYINVGLLARLENEAQLAQVLGHEVAHVVRRHSLQAYRTREATMIFANVADLALFGTSIIYLPALGALAGYSRENESEADRYGLQYLAAAGYPIGESERLFEIIQEVKQRDSLWGSVYSSHPDNQERAAQVRALVASGTLPLNADGPRGVDDYQNVRYVATLENIRLKLNVRQYQLAAASAEAGLGYARQSAQLRYYRGEAYRLMAEDADAAAHEQALIEGVSPSKEMVAGFRKRRPELLGSAKQSFRDSLSAEPNFALAHRGLGLVAYAQGDATTARAELAHYLEQGKDIKDRRYIETILGRIGK